MSKSPQPCVEPFKSVAREIRGALSMWPFNCLWASTSSDLFQGSHATCARLHVMFSHQPFAVPLRKYKSRQPLVGQKGTFPQRNCEQSFAPSTTKWCKERMNIPILIHDITWIQKWVYSHMVGSANVGRRDLAQAEPCTRMSGSQNQL